MITPITKVVGYDARLSPEVAVGLLTLLAQGTSLKTLKDLNIYDLYKELSWYVEAEGVIFESLARL